MNSRRWIKPTLMPILLLAALLACNFPLPTKTTDSPVEESEGTELSEVVDAPPLAEQEEQPASSGVTPTPSLTPTITVTPTPSLTPTFTFTPTPDIPMVSVTVNTNCRIGPGEGYKIVGALLVGEEAEILGISSEGYFYIIKNPDIPGGLCWLWDQYAEVKGDPSHLPRMTPPPSPTPAPTISYQIDATDFHFCGPDFVMMYWIGNDGPLALESAHVEVVNLTTTTTLFSGHTDAPFVANVASCPPGFDSLGMGGAAYIPVRLNPHPLGGDTVRATVRICALNGLGEPCETQTADFTVPSVSDVNQKSNFTPVTNEEVLEKVLQLPISTWNYKYQDPSIRHIGPMAQDFYRLFAVGDSETHIYPLDADGVALASIQALYNQMESMESRLAQLEAKQSLQPVASEKTPSTFPWWVSLLALGIGMGAGMMIHDWRTRKLEKK